MADTAASAAQNISIKEEAVHQDVPVKPIAPSPEPYSSIDEGIPVSPQSSHITDLPAGKLEHAFSAPGSADSCDPDLGGSTNGNPFVNDLLTFDLGSADQTMSPSESRADSRFEFDPLSAELVSPQKMEAGLIGNANAGVLVDSKSKESNIGPAESLSISSQDGSSNFDPFDPLGMSNIATPPPQPDVVMTDGQCKSPSTLNSHSYMSNLEVLGAPPPITPPEETEKESTFGASVVPLEKPLPDEASFTAPAPQNHGRPSDDSTMMNHAPGAPKGDLFVTSESPAPLLDSQKPSNLVDHSEPKERMRVIAEPVNVGEPSEVYEDTPESPITMRTCTPVHQDVTSSCQLNDVTTMPESKPLQDVKPVETSLSQINQTCRAVTQKQEQTCSEKVPTTSQVLKEEVKKAPKVISVENVAEDKQESNSVGSGRREQVKMEGKIDETCKPNDTVTLDVNKHDPKKQAWAESLAAMPVAAADLTSVNMSQETLPAGSVHMGQEMAPADLTSVNLSQEADGFLALSTSQTLSAEPERQTPESPTDKKPAEKDRKLFTRVAPGSQKEKVSTKKVVTTSSTREKGKTSKLLGLAPASPRKTRNSPTKTSTTPAKDPTSSQRCTSAERPKTAPVGTGPHKKTAKSRPSPADSANSKSSAAVRSKVRSLDNTTHTPGGGNVRIISKKTDYSNVQSKCGSKANIKHSPGGGDKKIESRKLDWKVESKVGSMDNARHRARGGDKKIESKKLEWKVESRVGSLDNARHKARGGDKKIETHKLDFKEKANPRTDTGTASLSSSEANFISEDE